MKKLLFVLCSLIGFCASAQQINYAEYYFDTDPGLGAGFPISVSPAGDSVSVNAAVSVNGLTPGFHIMYLRARNSAGTWSMYQGRKFYIRNQEPVVQNKIVRANFFFDADTGFTTGTTVTTVVADSINGSAVISTAGLAPGFHRLYARVRDSAGRWSMYKGEQFFIDGTPPITSAKIVTGEYFYDNDPGYGNATPLSTGAPADSLQLNIGFSMATLAPGFHNFYVRVKDSNGMWSNYQSGLLFKEASIPTAAASLVQAEYFINTDPGMGSGTPVPSFSAADSIDVNCAVATTGLAFGVDTLYVRVKDANGVWSFPQMRTFQIKDPTSVQALELDEDFDAVIIPNPVSSQANLHLKTSKPGLTSIAVVAYTGVKVYEMTIEFVGQKQVPLNLEHLPAGVYIIEVKNNGNRLVRQFVKQ